MKLEINPSLNEKGTKTELWVPVYDQSHIKTHKAEYGAISWAPREIPYGKQLEIDVSGANKFIELCTPSITA